jgi:alpha-methylacyl-CoA racemase
VPAHPHLAARGTIVESGGTPQAAPAPRFSRTTATVPGPPGDPEPVEQVLDDWAG